VRRDIKKVRLTGYLCLEDETNTDLSSRRASIVRDELVELGAIPSLFEVGTKLRVNPICRPNPFGPSYSPAQMRYVAVELQLKTMICDDGEEDE
jgi:hypothetical protein